MQVLAALLVLLAVSSALAATITWTGYAQNNQWNTAVNWNPDTVPGPDDDVVVYTGDVEITTPTVIKSLLMGNQLEGYANLTIFSSFVVTNHMLVLAHGNVILASGATAVTASPSFTGNLAFRSGSISGAWTVAGLGDLSGPAEKVLSGAILTLQGPSLLGGIVSIQSSSQLVIAGASTWIHTRIQAAPNATNAVFDTRQGTVTISTNAYIQADGSFGALQYNAGNITIFNTVTFQSAVNIPNNSWVTTLGSAVLNVALSGSGNFVSQGQSTTFGSMSFDGLIVLSGQSADFSGSQTSVNNVWMNAGTVAIDTGAVVAAAVFSISSGQFNVNGALSAQQLNFLGAASINGGRVTAQNLYSKAGGFGVNSWIVVTTAANFDASQLNFQPNSGIHLKSGSSGQTSGAVSLNGPPSMTGLVVDGTFELRSSITSTNIAVTGSGTWKVSGTRLSVSGSQIAASQITLTHGGEVSGIQSCVNVGAIAAGTVKAKIGPCTFQCSGQCTNVNAGCSPMPTENFRFSG